MGHLHLVLRLGMDDGRNSLPQNAFKQHIMIAWSSTSAHTIFYIVTPSTLISHGTSSRDAFRSNFVFYMNIIFHTHITLIFLISCRDYEAQHHAVLFARRSLPFPQFCCTCSQTSYTKLHILPTRRATLLSALWQCAVSHTIILMFRRNILPPSSRIVSQHTRPWTLSEFFYKLIQAS